MKITATYTNFDRDIESVSVAFEKALKQTITIGEKEIPSDSGTTKVKVMKMSTTGDNITNYEEEITQEKLTEYISMFSRILRQLKE